MHKKRKDKKEGLIGNIVDYFASKVQLCNFYQYDARHIPPILNQINFNVNSWLIKGMNQWD